MSQNTSVPSDQDAPANAKGAPQPTDEAAASPLEAQVTDDLGGVQGSSPDEDSDQIPLASNSASGSPAEEPAPDAGEIEWAGQLLKKPPSPGA